MSQLQIAFDVLGEPHRRDILDRLWATPLTVGEIVEATGLSQPGASKHLRMLRDSGFVAVEKRGKQRVYRIAAGSDGDPIMHLDAWLVSYRERWSRTLDALGAQLESSHSDKEES